MENWLISGGHGGDGGRRRDDLDSPLGSILERAVAIELPGSHALIDEKVELIFKADDCAGREIPGSLGASNGALLPQASIDLRRTVVGVDPFVPHLLEALEVLPAATVAGTKPAGQCRGFIEEEEPFVFLLRLLPFRVHVAHDPRIAVVTVAGEGCGTVTGNLPAIAVGVDLVVPTHPKSLPRDPRQQTINSGGAPTRVVRIKTSRVWFHYLSKRGERR